MTDALPSTFAGEARRAFGLVPNPNTSLKETELCYCNHQTYGFGFCKIWVSFMYGFEIPGFAYVQIIAAQNLINLNYIFFYLCFFLTHLYMKTGVCQKCLEQY